MKGGSQAVLRLDGTALSRHGGRLVPTRGSYAEGLGREDKAGVPWGCWWPGVGLRVALVRRLSPRVMRPA